MPYLEVVQLYCYVKSHAALELYCKKNSDDFNIMSIRLFSSVIYYYLYIVYETYLLMWWPNSVYE